MSKLNIKKIQALRESLHAAVEDAVIPLLREQGVDPASHDNSRYNLAITLDGGVVSPVADAWIEYWAEDEFSGCGIEWVLKYTKDCCAATANNKKYQKTARGARAFIRNWLKKAKEWAGDQPQVPFVGDAYERKNG